jgi:Short C-terminal domain
VVVAICRAIVATRWRVLDDFGVTTFAERVFGRSFGRQPEIADGVRGEALVLQSIASLTPSLMNMDRLIVGSWKAWACSIPLLVSLPGCEPYAVSPVRWMWRSKYPIGGTTLPVTVDRGDRSILRIDWEEVPDIDEWIAAGHPVFTDPESIQARFVEGWQTSRAAIVEAGSSDVADQIARAAGSTAGIDRDRVQQLIADLQAEHAECEPKPVLHRPQIDGPSGRILAVGRQDANAYDAWGEVLLSVAVPGSPRYGVRCEGWVPSAKIKVEWWDVPVDIHPKHPDKVKIRWDEVPGIEVFAPLIHEASERLKAQLTGEPATTMNPQAFQHLLNTIADPARRADVERQLAEGLRAAPGAAPPAAPDPLDELARLGERRAAGKLTDAEFAAEKARLLGEL